MTSIAEALIAEGRDEGEKKGRDEGRLDFLNFLRRTLTYRFKLEQEYTDEDLEALELPALTTLSQVVFEVPTLEQFERRVRCFWPNNGPLRKILNLRLRVRPGVRQPNLRQG